VPKVQVLDMRKIMGRFLSDTGISWGNFLEPDCYFKYRYPERSSAGVLLDKVA
jgi:hypothetical protein